MAHQTRMAEEFLTEDDNYRIDVEGNLTTEDRILVQREDMSAFIGWLEREYNKTVGNDG